MAAFFVAAPAWGDETALSVRAGSELDYPPFSIVTPGGEADGFAVELMRAALNAVGRRVEYSVAPWHQLKEELAAGRIEALPLMARTAERDQAYDFSVPYLTMSGVIVVREGDTAIRGRDDLRGREVLAMRGDIADEYLRAYDLTGRLTTTLTVEEALRRLAGGEGDAVVVQKLVAQKLITALELEDLRLVDPPLPDFQSFAFAVKAGDAELLAALNEGLALVIADGTYERLRRKWLTPLTDEARRPVLPVMIAVLSTLLLAWAAALLWQRSLLRMVRLRSAELESAYARLGEEQLLRERLEAEARLAGIAASVPGVICSFLLQRDGSAHFPYASPAVEQLSGFAAEQLARDAGPVFDRMHEEDAIAVRQAIAESAQQLASLQAEFRYVHPTRGELWIAGHARPRRQADGSTLWHGYLYETTESRRIGEALRSSERRLRAVFDNAAVGMAEVSLDGRFLRVNWRLCQMLGFTAEQLLGTDFQHLSHPDDLDHDREQVQRLLAGEVSSFCTEKRHVRSDGTVVWTNLCGSLVLDADERPDFFVAVVEDITDRQLALQALQRRGDELERINAELEEFAYVASHDLKAPLRAVANLAYVIDEDVAEGLDAENRNRLRLLRRRVARMDELIEGLLRYARLGRAAEEPMPVALAPLLKKLVGELALPVGFHVAVDYAALPTLTGNPLQLTQIFQNLIANAIAHHDRDTGTVWIDARDGGDRWIVEVADDGPGIPAQTRQQVFRMFYGEGTRGSGIGLAIVRKLVLNCRGRIEVLDNRPRGARFRLSWPK